MLGHWLGHALHPLLTDLPLRASMSASLLDLGSRDPRFAVAASRTTESRGMIGP